MPLFSIIIPLYKKYERYYLEVVSSILNQTCDDYECILIYYDHFFNEIKNEHVRYVKSTSDDVSVKRNIGIENAKGSYIVFCDSDDCLSKTTIQTFKSIIQKYNNPDYICSLSVRSKKELDEESCNSKVKFINNKELLNDYIFGRYLNDQIV